jgi:hypothetical protein
MKIHWEKSHSEPLEIAKTGNVWYNSMANFYRKYEKRINIGEDRI